MKPRRHSEHRTRARADAPVAYTPIDWSDRSDCKLSAHERELVDIMRRDLWKSGVRREPQLTAMAFEFACVCASMQAADGGGR